MNLLLGLNGPAVLLLLVTATAGVAWLAGHPRTCQDDGRECHPRGGWNDPADFTCTRCGRSWRHISTEHLGRFNAITWEAEPVRSRLVQLSRRVVGWLP